MANKNKTVKNNNISKSKKQENNTTLKSNDYFWSMSYAPKISEGYHWFQVCILAFWTAVIIMFVRMQVYERDMAQFYWANNESSLTDFFSYFKMIIILSVCALAILTVVFRLVTQSFCVKKTSIYIPMMVYVLFALLSYFMSDNKDFAWLGYNDRFEGTIVLLAYMFMLFYAINTVFNEKHTKIVVYATAIASALLGILGVSQGIGKDFFRTPMGQKLMAPNYMLESGSTIHQMIDAAAAKGQQYFNFTFQNNEIYQTVYNINYVSFYLTLLIPLFGLIFIQCFNAGKQEKLWKKIAFAALFALLIYNLIGAASSGGFFGMLVVVVFAFIILNKRIIKWWKPVAILIVITALVAGMTYNRWMPELRHASKSVTGGTVTVIDDRSGHLDYFETVGNDLWMSVDNAVVKIAFDVENEGLVAEDVLGDKLTFALIDEETYGYELQHEAYKAIEFRPVMDSAGAYYIFVDTNYPEEKQWKFKLTDDGIMYLNELNKLVKLSNIPAIGFENNLSFGSGRGYIWSRTFPMMAETFLVGYGADTYVMHFPQNDYAGKYSANWSINTIVDKPHNLYMGMWIGTGGISCIAFLSILVLYAIQSIRLYFRKEYEGFLEYAGLGLFLGVMGFAFTGLVDDSTVSVMPMFYGLLGTGIATNMILTDKKAKVIE